MHNQQVSLNNTSKWIIIGMLGVYAYALLTASPGRRGPAALALGFQMLCWAVSLILLVRRDPLGQLRISNPAVLVMFWSAIYLVIPSIIWVQGAAIPQGWRLTTDVVVELFWMHGLFMLGFVGGYLLIRPATRIHAKVDLRRLPSGWLLFLVPLIPVIWGVFKRLVSGGGILPGGSYGGSWYSMQEGIQSARAAGGLDYVRRQVMSKVWFYPSLMQATGLGLIILRALGSGRNQKRTLAFSAAVILGMLLLGSGGRSATIVILLIGLVLADLLVGPIRWQYIGPMVLVGLVMFDLFGLFRAHRSLPQAVEEYLSPDYPRLSEFTVMLPKEATAVQLVRTSGRVEGANYLVQSVFLLVPSQLLSSKLSWETTGTMLSREMLGPSFYAGAGVAGAIIGDGYRFARTVGVPLLAALMGAIIGWVQRWVMGTHRAPKSTNLLKLSLWAGFLGWAFNLIRSDLGGLLVMLLYNLAIPWLVLTVMLLEPEINPWIVPLVRLAGPNAFTADDGTQPLSPPARRSAPHLPIQVSHSADES